MVVPGEAGPFFQRFPVFLAYHGRDDRSLQTLWGGMASEILGRAFPPAPLAPPPRRGERIRVCVVSPFFVRHANWRMPMQGWLENLDRDRFAIFGYCPSALHDATTAHAATLCEKFVHGLRSLAEWRETIIADRPHVLIYPGLMLDGLCHLLAGQRLAPLQITGWGHPMTSGLSTMDWFLSSDAMEPEGAQAHYSERLLRLPGFGCTVSEAGPAPAPVSRRDLGISARVVYWCGQSPPKFQPRHDAVFAEIAAQVGDCAFLFGRLDAAVGATEIFQERLTAAFGARGLRMEDHCVFRPAAPPERFRAELATCDAYLDTPAWGGCNTTLDALDAGLPIITTPGPVMRARHGAGILGMMGLGAKVAPDLDAYIAQAVRLGRDGEARGAFGAELHQRRGRLTGEGGRPEAALGEAIADALRALPHT